MFIAAQIYNYIYMYIIFYKYLKKIFITRVWLLALCTDLSNKTDPNEKVSRTPRQGHRRLFPLQSCYLLFLCHDAPWADNSDLFRADAIRFQTDEADRSLFFSHEPMRRRGDQDFPFHQDADLFALSGIDQTGTLLVLVRGASSKDVKALSVHSPWSENTIWMENDIKKDAHRISVIEYIHNIKDGKNHKHLISVKVIRCSECSIDAESTNGSHRDVEWKRRNVANTVAGKTFLSAQRF